MARFDWIMIGLFISSSKLAEYSFAYKIFEVSTLPLLIVAPIMIPLFTRINKLSENINNIFFFLEWQIIIASLIAFMLNICWIPVIDFITDGKYGSVNSNTILLTVTQHATPLLHQFLVDHTIRKRKPETHFFHYGVLLCSKYCGLPHFNSDL